LVTDGAGIVILLGWFASPHLYAGAGWPVLPIIPLFVLGLSRESGLLARALSRRPLVWLGDISYSIYLIHMVVLIPLGYALRALNLDGLFLIWLLVGGSATLMLSTVSYYWFERPARDWIRALPLPTPIRLKSARKSQKS
jgi:peptidoglycan/LPS O-acetylase OafA/YrhL